MTCPVRRNQPGDRAKALELILPLVESQDKVASDIYCLCGRIYKDMFMSSGFSDQSSRDQACCWYARRSHSPLLSVRIRVFVMTKGMSVCLIFIRYGKAFETEPTLHSGINVVVLLMAAGHEFETSIEIRKIGALNNFLSNGSSHHIGGVLSRFAFSIPSLLKTPLCIIV